MSEDFRDETIHNFIHISKLTSMKTHEELEKIGLYRGQPPLLFALWRKDEQSGRELAEALDVKPATVTKMVQRLSGKGFVTTQQDQEDARVTRVCLTQQGKAIEPQVRKIYKKVHNLVFQGFNEEEKTHFEETLKRMRQNILGSMADVRVGDHEKTI